jgi:hypothetical protein
MASKEQTTEFIKALELVGADTLGVTKALGLVEGLQTRAVSSKQYMASLRPDGANYVEKSQAAALTWQALTSQTESAMIDLDAAIEVAKRTALASDLPAPLKAKLKEIDTAILEQLFQVAEQLKVRYQYCQGYDAKLSTLQAWAYQLNLEAPGGRPGIGDEGLGVSPGEHFKKYLNRFARAFGYGSEPPADKVTWFERHHI